MFAPAARLTRLREGNKIAASLASNQAIDRRRGGRHLARVRRRVHGSRRETIERGRRDWLFSSGWQEMRRNKRTSKVKVRVKWTGPKPAWSLVLLAHQKTMFNFYGPNWTFGLNYIRVSISRIAQPVRKWKEVIFFFWNRVCSLLLQKSRFIYITSPKVSCDRQVQFKPMRASRIFRANGKYNKKLQKIALER